MEIHSKAPDRWFIVNDGSEAREFCPLYRLFDPFILEMNQPAGWCRCTWESEGDFWMIHVPPYADRFAMEDVQRQTNEGIEFLTQGIQGDQGWMGAIFKSVHSAE